MARSDPYWLQCHRCDESVPSLAQWIDQGQSCVVCGQVDASIVYSSAATQIRRALASAAGPPGMWRYQSVLPVVESAGKVTFGEGSGPVEPCPALEEYVARLGVHCRVWVHRFDESPGTGTFKDLAASLLATVLSECGVKRYVAASTGNLGVALARYLAEAGIEFWAFLPHRSPATHDTSIQSFRQNVVRIRGDYAAAQQSARNFARSTRSVAWAGGMDPLRLEAKKTIAFEWFRQLGEIPTVYVQALSGGTGPLGIAKGLHELRSAEVASRVPRMYLVQTDRCAPMASAWRRAEEAAFAEGWLHRYPVLRDPATDIATLATGNPTLFPYVARIVHASGGQILSVPESTSSITASALRQATGISVGPASSVAIQGFLRLAQNRQIRDGDQVVVALGDGPERASAEWRALTEDAALTLKHRNLDQCFRFSARAA